MRSLHGGTGIFGQAVERGNEQLLVDGYRGCHARGRGYRNTVLPVRAVASGHVASGGLNRRVGTGHDVVAEPGQMQSLMKAIGRQDEDRHSRADTLIAVAVDAVWN